MPFCKQAKSFSNLSDNEVVREWKTRGEIKKKEYEKFVSDIMPSSIKEHKGSKKKKKKLKKTIKKVVRKELAKRGM